MLHKTILPGCVVFSPHSMHFAGVQFTYTLQLAGCQLQNANAELWLSTMLIATLLIYLISGFSILHLQTDNQLAKPDPTHSSDYFHNSAAI